jgi:hypothetical protein
MLQVNSPTNRKCVRGAIAGMITLRSGFLRVSRSSVPGAGLGLWCCRTLPRRASILYGGILVDGGVASNSHSRHTGVPGMMMDGVRFSRCFDAKSDSWSILPSFKLIEKEFPEYQPHQHAAIKDIILDTGIAYMVNGWMYDNVKCATPNCKSRTDPDTDLFPTLNWYDITGASGPVELFCNYKHTTARNGITDQS